MLITLTGANSFSIHRKLNELTASFINKYGELALEKFDGEEAEQQAISDSLNSLPFLSPRKLVVIRNGAANKQFTDKIEQTISSIPDSTDVIFYEPSLDKRTAYFKVLKTKTDFQEFGQLDKPQLAKFLVDEAKKQGAKLAFSDASYMVERLGENQQLLFNELTKLAIYNYEITRENIDLLTDPTPQSSVFNLLDAAFSGQKKRALKLYEDQRAQKVEPKEILSMIAWQLRLLSFVKLAGSRSSLKISQDTGLNTFPINKASALADRVSGRELQSMVNEAVDIDLKVKTTNYDLDEALKTYITTL